MSFISSIFASAAILRVLGLVSHFSVINHYTILKIVIDCVYVDEELSGGYHIDGSARGFFWAKRQFNSADLYVVNAITHECIIIITVEP